MASLGRASTAIGRPSAAVTSWPTSGIRDDPPTSSTAAHVGHGHARRGDGPAQRHQGLVQRRADHRLELGAGEAHLGVAAGEQHRDRSRRSPTTAPPWRRRTPRAAGRGRWRVRGRRGRRACRRRRPGSRGRAGTRRGRSRCRRGARCRRAGPRCSKPPAPPTARRRRRTCRRPGRRPRRPCPAASAPLGGVGRGRRHRLGHEVVDRHARRGAGPGAAGRACTRPSWPGGSRPATRAARPRWPPPGSTTHATTRAMSSSADTGEPPSSSGVGSPTRRLNSRATRWGCGHRPPGGGLAHERTGRRPGTPPRARTRCGCRGRRPAAAPTAARRRRPTAAAV